MGLFPDWNDDMGRAYLRSKIGLILGGPPSQHDFRPSLTCVFIYASLLIPLGVRLYNRTLSFKRLWKLLLVILISIIAFSIRIKLSEGQNWNKDLFVTEMIMLRFTTILLTITLINFFQDALAPYLPTKQNPNLTLDIFLVHFITGLRAAAFFCLAMTVAISFDVKQAINGSPEARTKLHRSKEVTIYLLMAINGSIFILTITPAYLLWRGTYDRELVFNRRKEVIKFAFLLAICSLLLIVTCFKTIQLASSNMHDKFAVVINRKSLYYGICVLSEYLVCLLFVTLPWYTIIPPREKLQEFVQSKKSGGIVISSPIMTGEDHHFKSDAINSNFQLYPILNDTSNHHRQMTYEEYLNRSEGYSVSATPPSNKKRDSAQTLSTISEVRMNRGPMHLVAITTPNLGMGRARASSCHAYGKDNHFPNDVFTSPRISMPSALDCYPAPLPSANGSLHSHWSDDSDEEKKGFASILTLVRVRRGSLSRKNSNKSSRSSIGKGDKSADSIETVPR